MDTIKYNFYTRGAIWLASQVIKVDPFFHYHKPDVETYFYTLDNQRSQNDGILKHFDYDAIITGTSMVENFKVSEMNELFGVNSIKVPFSGGSYKEINDGLTTALEYNENIKCIVRCLDISRFFDDKELMRQDLGKYPTYLYDKNPLNDYEYVLNRNVLFYRTIPVIQSSKEPWYVPGIRSFDDYSNWMGNANIAFGASAIYPQGWPSYVIDTETKHITAEEKEIIRGNIQQNVTALAKKYPEVTFYCYFSPYSLAWWLNLGRTGNISRYVEAEAYIIELLLECDNIKLFSFNNCTEIITDLNNYKDLLHYGEWINSLILKWMHDDKYLLTKENYQDYIAEELAFYSSYDYSLIQEQMDYECDYYAAALWNEEINGVQPLLLTEALKPEQVMNADVLVNESGETYIQCKGSLQRGSADGVKVSDYLLHSEYSGCRIEIEDVDKYSYLMFEAKRSKEHGQASIYVYNEDEIVVAEYTNTYHDTDTEWHQYYIDMSDCVGDVKIIFNGAYIDNTGSVESEYLYKDIILY